MQGKETPDDAMGQVYVGLDVCKDRLDGHIHPANHTLPVSNDHAGVKTLMRALGALNVALIVLEATGKHHRMAARLLAAAGYQVAVVNPRRARQFMDAAGVSAKTDRVDAQMLAIMGAALAPQGRLPACAPASQAQDELAELVRAKHAAQTELTALTNRRTAAQSRFLQVQLARAIKTKTTHIARLTAEIDRRLMSDPELARRFAILTSIPGVGPATATDLLVDMAELGTLDRHAAASLAGLAPFPDDSGARTGLRRIKGGRGSAPRALHGGPVGGALQPRLEDLPPAPARRRQETQGRPGGRDAQTRHPHQYAPERKSRVDGELCAHLTGNTDALPQAGEGKALKSKRFANHRGDYSASHSNNSTVALNRGLL